MTEPGSDAKIGAPRRSWPHWRGIALAAGVAVLGIAAIVGLREPSPDVPRYDVVEADAFPAAMPADPLRAELARCRTVPAHVEDARCRMAWEVNRRRFHGESRSLPQALPATPGPGQEGERCAMAGVGVIHQIGKAA